jgi:TonB family protein
MKMKGLLIFALGLQSIVTLGQSNCSIFDVTDNFIDGGSAGFSSFVSENYNYPDSALKNDVSGKIIVRFTVDTLGLISNVSTLNKKFGYGLEEEAIRLIKSTSGMWFPFEINGVKQSMSWTLPLIICIF